MFYFFLLQMASVNFLRCLSPHRFGPAAPQCHNQGARQNRLRVRFKAEIRVHQMGRYPTAIGIHILPDAGTHTVSIVAVCLIAHGIIAEQRKKRCEQASRPHFLHKIPFAEIING